MVSARTGRRIGPATAARVVALAVAGYTWREIARSLRCGTTTVHRILRRDDTPGRRRRRAHRPYLGDFREGARWRLGGTADCPEMIPQRAAPRWSR